MTCRHEANVLDYSGKDSVIVCRLLRVMTRGKDESPMFVRHAVSSTSATTHNRTLPPDSACKCNDLSLYVAIKPLISLPLIIDSPPIVLKKLLARLLQC